MLVGDGGVTVASGFGSYAESGDNATIEVTLTEDQFYHVPEDVDDIRYDVATKLSAVKICSISLFSQGRQITRT